MGILSDYVESQDDIRSKTKRERRYPAPDAPGLYLARTAEQTWWNLVVQVIGKAPFLGTVVWVRFGEVNRLLDASSFIWGPKIDEPGV